MSLRRRGGREKERTERLRWDDIVIVAKNQSSSSSSSLGYSVDDNSITLRNLGPPPLPRSSSSSTASPVVFAGVHRVTVCVFCKYFPSFFAWKIFTLKFLSHFALAGGRTGIFHLKTPSNHPVVHPSTISFSSLSCPVTFSAPFAQCKGGWICFYLNSVAVD